MPKRTMKTFDELCLIPVKDLSPAEIRAIPLREQASQAVFTRYLNVTAGLVSQWERGTKRPRGALTEAVDAGGEEGTASGVTPSAQSSRPAGADDQGAQ